MEDADRKALANDIGEAVSKAMREMRADTGRQRQDGDDQMADMEDIKRELSEIQTKIDTLVNAINGLNFSMMNR